VQGENTLEEPQFSPAEAAVARTPAASPAGVTGATTPGTPAVIVEVALGLERDLIPTARTKTDKNRRKKKRMNNRMKKAAQVC
jgi:hypothetical protein